MESDGHGLPALMASAADLFQGKHFGSIIGSLAAGRFFWAQRLGLG